MWWTGLRSLRVRLTLLVIAALLPVLWLFVYTAQDQRESAEREVTEDVRQFARLVAAQQERLFESTRQLLFTAARLPETRRAKRPECRALLANLLAAYPVYDNMGVADPGGDVACMARPHPPVNIAGRPHFERALRSRDFAMGEYLVSEVTGRPQLSFAYPILDEDGEVAGVVYAAMDLQWVNRLAEQTPLPQGAVLALIDRKGTVVVRAPDPGRHVGQSVANTEFHRNVRELGTEVDRFKGLDDTERLFAVEPISDPTGASGHVVVGVPAHVASVEPARLLKRNLRVLAVVAAATLLVLWLGGSWVFLRRVRALVAATERIRQGDFGARTGLRHQRDELGLLARAFDEMASQTQEAVRRKDESLALIDTLLVSAPVGIAYFDRRLRYSKVNEQLAEWNGLSPAEHLGRTIDEVIPEYAPVLRPAAQRVFETGEPVTGLELTGGRQGGVEGSPRTWLSGFYPVRAGSEIVGVGEVVLDITPRKREEEAQRFLADASRVLSESLRGEATFHSVARLAVPVLGDWCVVNVARESGALDQVAVAFAHPDDAPLAARIEKGYTPIVGAPYGPGRVALSGRSVRRNDLDVDRAARLIAPNDPTREERLKLFRELGIHGWMTVPMALHGRVFGTITLLRSRTRCRFDAQEQGLAEELGRRAALALENAELYEATEQAVRLREQFISVASHELRTPLTPLKLQLQTLKRKVFQGAASSPAELGPKFDLALRQTDRLTKLVNDLLDVSRLSLGKLQLHREEMDLASAVQEVADRFHEEATRAGCELHVEVPEQVVGSWDPSRIEQVLVNLLSNAIKYGAGKPIELRLEPPHDGGTARLIVRDHGIGIAVPDKDRIFERFERAVSERAYGGLGLGLYIAREIVIAHGGTISVQSAEGEGSTFIVELPLEGHAPLAAPEPATAAPLSP